MRIWNLFAGVAVATAVLLTGSVAEAQKIPKSLKTAQVNAQPCTLDLKRAHWTEVPAPLGGGTVCVPPGLSGRFSLDFPPGLKGVPPPGWPASP
jgi:hypothetical protein